MALLLCHWREKDRERQAGRRRKTRRRGGGKRGKQMERHWDGRRRGVHACVWSHVRKCVFSGCQKKSGTTDITPSATEEERGRGERMERGVNPRKGDEREGWWDQERRGEERKKEARRGAGCLPLSQQMCEAPPPVSGYLATINSDLWTSSLCTHTHTDCVQRNNSTSLTHYFITVLNMWGTFGPLPVRSVN